MVEIGGRTAELTDLKFRQLVYGLSPPKRLQAVKINQRDFFLIRRELEHRARSLMKMFIFALDSLSRR